MIAQKVFYSLNHLPRRQGILLVVFTVNIHLSIRQTWTELKHKLKSIYHLSSYISAVCVVCIGYMCVLVHIPKCVQVETRGWNRRSSIMALHLIFLRLGLSQNLDLIILNRLSVSPHTALRLEAQASMSTLNMGVKNVKSSHYTYIASILSTKAFPLSKKFNINLLMKIKSIRVLKSILGKTSLFLSRGEFNLTLL